MSEDQLDPGIETTCFLLHCHRLDKELAASAGLSIDEFHCLGQLYIHVPCCVRTLREALGIDPTRVSKLLHSLEARAYLTRTLDFDDKRKEMIRLTPEGEATARELLQSAALSVRQLAQWVPGEISRHISTARDTTEIGQQ